MSDFMSRLPVLNQQQARAVPKGLPTVLVKQERKKSKDALEKAFRSAVWARDKSRCRATRKPLSKQGSDYDRVGEVHHCLARSTSPEAIYDVSNGILLSKSAHVMAETRCPNAPDKCLLDIDGPPDRAKPQTFIFRDVHGTELKRRTS